MTTKGERSQSFLALDEVSRFICRNEAKTLPKYVCRIRDNAKIVFFWLSRSIELQFHAKVVEKVSNQEALPHYSSFLVDNPYRPDNHRLCIPFTELGVKVSDHKPPARRKIITY